MNFKKFFKKSRRIEFSVDGKPPKKTHLSLWSKNSHQTQKVIDLRKAALKEINKKELDDYFHGPVKLTLTVYDPNPLERKNRHDYLGDLDGIVAGVFESLQPLPPEINKLEIDPKLKENKEISHDVALIVSDDAQISTAVAKKRENKKPSYTVVVEDDNTENS